MICALVSILTGAIVPANVAMTGEVTLRGHVTPIGGVKVCGSSYHTGG
jgi:ATP-dependent Lon protease